MAGIAKGEASARAAQQDFSGHAVALVTDATPHQICLTELTQSLLAVCCAEPALASSVIDETRPSAAGWAKQGVDFSNAGVSDHGLEKVRPLPKTSCKMNPSNQIACPASRSSQVLKSTTRGISISPRIRRKAFLLDH